MTKRCGFCRRAKPLTDFAADPSRRDGYRANCRECWRLYFQQPKPDRKPAISPYEVTDCRERPCLEDRTAGAFNRWDEQVAPGEQAIDRDRRNNEAIALCTNFCPVYAACRAWALTWPDPCAGHSGVGLVLAGLTTRERARERRRLMREVAA